MKKLTFTIITAVIATFWFCTRPGSDVKSIKKVINDSYIGGIHNRGGSEVIRQGFSGDFEMLIFRDNEISKLPLESWILNIERQIEESPIPPGHKASAKYLDVDITGNTAVVKLELHREGKRLFTDYLVLYKFNDGWKIGSKFFYRH